MTADNRTNEPTEAQVEAAAKALRADSMLCHMNGSAVPFEELARAALAAAAGAAPTRFNLEKLMTVIGVALDATEVDALVTIEHQEHLEQDIRRELSHWLETGDDLEVQQVSESNAITLVEEVIAIHADRIDTHYGDCYKYHVACLAIAVKHRLGGESR